MLLCPFLLPCSPSCSLPDHLQHWTLPKPKCSLNSKIRWRHSYAQDSGGFPFTQNKLNPHPGLYGCTVIWPWSHADPPPAVLDFLTFSSTVNLSSRVNDCLKPSCLYAPPPFFLSLGDLSLDVTTPFSDHLSKQSPLIYLLSGTSPYLITTGAYITILNYVIHLFVFVLIICLSHMGGRQGQSLTCFLFSQPLEECLEHSRHSINICSVKEWMHGWTDIS